MANSTRTQKARHAASSVGSNEYVRRLIEDEELRNSIREAYDAGRARVRADPEAEAARHGR